MDQTDLEAMFLRDLRRVPKVLSAIRKAAKAQERRATLTFPPFDDDPMLLYACWAVARKEGVTLVLSPE